MTKRKMLVDWQYPLQYLGCFKERNFLNFADLDDVWYYGEPNSSPFFTSQRPPLTTCDVLVFLPYILDFDLQVFVLKQL